MKNFDISVTNPLFTGTTIIGSNKYQQELKNKIKNQPITPESIKYNLDYSKNQEEQAKMYPNNSIESICAKSYEKSFKINAEELSRGHKLLTINKNQL
jgi:hypothetical protein